MNGNLSDPERVARVLLGTAGIAGALFGDRLRPWARLSLAGAGAALVSTGAAGY